MHCKLLLDCHARVIMADTWKKLNDKERAKRTRIDNPKDHRRRPKGKELTVKRLSADVSGKAQKYTQIGLREFVSQPMLFQQIQDV